HDSHNSMHHAAPLLELNETDILQSHDADPISYWIHDWERSMEEVKENYRGLMVLHVVGMMVAFFGLLPAGIALRGVRHRWYPAVLVTFNVLAWFSAFTGSLYKKLTGDLYEGASHGSGGWLIVFFATGLAVCDGLSTLKRVYHFLRSPERRNIRAFWSKVILNQDEHLAEYAHLVHDEPQEYEEAKFSDEPESNSQHRRINTSIESVRMRSSDSIHEWSRFAGTSVGHSRQHSVASNQSDETLHSPGILSRSDAHDSDEESENTPFIQKFLRYAYATAERTLVLMAFSALLSGLSVYSGICRGNYLNGCLAHLIKGGIFWCYGLLSFGRYLGAWADFGWAWNRLPARRSRKVASAEMVESSVIFFYGITNTWMERFGAAPGSPFTTKQVQHISIAVMFWFAGLLGMALESKTVRKWLSARATSVVKSDENVTPPPSYSGSFNPFPALVIGVTGAAMSAHHQTYQFQVQVHALWGFFLSGFAILRCMTYFFLWLRPPHSVLPSRPPTEAMASFFLACGGLVFILSTEQITFAAMRRGMDDIMFIFNFAVAVTCLAFCWMLLVVGFKGWMNYR
ncbi:hypothetical protein M422DRAFT_88038, partial [Sphaerobolus stellatus SS14]